MAKKKRTPAQKRATAKLVAANKRRAKAPARRAVAKRRAPTHAPKRARRKAVGYTVGRAPIRRRKMNPIRRGGMKGIVKNLAVPAATAAGGALALDAIWAYLPIPAAARSGKMRHVAKALGAVGLKYAAGAVVSKKTADELAFGALTVVFHAAARELMAESMPSVRMDGMGYMSPALPAGTKPVNSSMGFYPSAGMGYYPPAAQVSNAPIEGESTHQY